MANRDLRMSTVLLKHLACACCGGSLRLAPEGQRESHAFDEGALECMACGASIPIRNGVPRFVDNGHHAASRTTQRTRQVYNFTWRRFGRREIAQRWEKDSYRYVQMIPRELMSGAARVGLDAGCGSGADLVRIAAGGAQLIGCDLSDGVEVAAQATAPLPNVLVVQADLQRLPFRPDTFDFIYSFGVLHHLPDPQEGMRRLAALLKPGGSLVTYLYEDFSDRSRVERAILNGLRVVRAMTSRLPLPWLFAGCWLLTPLVWLTCCLPARVLRAAWPQLVGRLPFRHTLRWPVVASDLFDRFAPPLEWRFSRTDVMWLYERAGLTHVEIRHYRGWVSWGFKLDPKSPPAFARQEVSVATVG